MDNGRKPPDRQIVSAVEALIGWHLDTEARDGVLQRCRQYGESAQLLARRIESLAAARDALNDPDASLYPSPTRPEDDDPRYFRIPHTRRA